MTQYQPQRRVLDRRTREAIGADRTREVKLHITFDTSRLTAALDKAIEAIPCQPVTVAWFRNEELVRLEQRHVRCFPPHPSTELDITAWRTA